jgi:Protein of unknown function (DUF3631)
MSRDYLKTAVLDEAAAFVRRFVVVNEAQADTLALWVAHTHAAVAFDSTPYLAVTSAEKRSGKSRLLEVLELVVHHPLMSANTSDAALFRSISKFTPTLLLDEVDAIFKSKEREDLRGLLNAGYRRGAKVLRMGGPRNTTLEEFTVFCPKAFAGIGNALPDTITDRSITILLQRKTRDETVDHFRRRDVSPVGEILRHRLADWIEPQVDELQRLRPDLPSELDDRAQDIWEPLLAIATLAGGDWPARAWGAALELSGNGNRDDDSITAQLLRDIYAVFASGANTRLRTSDLIELLAEIEESPWGDWYGKPITPQALSRLLRPHRIKTMPVKVDGETVRGYKLEQFAEAFSRVLGVTGVTGVTSKSPSQAGGNASNAGNAYLAGEAAVLAEVDELVAGGVGTVVDNGRADHWACLCGSEQPKQGGATAEATLVSLRKPVCPFCGRKFKEEYKYLGGEERPEA